MLNGDRAIHAASREGDALAWLQAEFHLDAARFAAIKRLHDDYSIVCGEHCSAILAARERRAPAAEIAALENVCVEAMTAHFRRVASEMQPVEGVRYLATVLMLPPAMILPSTGCGRAKAMPSLPSMSPSRSRLAKLAAGKVTLTVA